MEEINEAGKCMISFKQQHLDNTLFMMIFFFLHLMHMCV